MRKVNGRRRSVRRVLRANGASPELHCMAIPTDRETLLLPTAVMEEVIDFQPPAAIEFAPPWLLGQVEWDNRQVPVFSFTALINGTEPGQIPDTAKIMILKSLTDSGRVPYLGVLLCALPRPVTVQPEHLLETGDEKKSLGVFKRVHYADEDAIIPDLDRLAHLVTHAAFGALPITQLETDAS